MTIKKFLQTLAYSITNGENVSININDKDIAIEIHDGDDGDYVLPCVVFRDARKGLIIAIIHEMGYGVVDYWDSWTESDIEIYGMEV